MTGLILLVLGIVIWTAGADELVPAHELVGVVLVLGLWVLEFRAYRAGVSRGIVGLVALWGLLLPALGVWQEQIMPGAAHWMVQVAHLLTGLVAVALGDLLPGAIVKAERRALYR